MSTIPRGDAFGRYAFLQAPAFYCARCGRRLGKVRAHYLIGDDVYCVGCIDAIDGYDRCRGHGSRAAIAYLLGVWP